MYKLFIHLYCKMGLKYILFRIWYFLAKKTGLLKFLFNTKFQLNSFISLSEWRNNYRERFLFKSSIDLNFKPVLSHNCKIALTNLRSNKFEFFNSGIFYHVPSWYINPKTEYIYDPVHWTEIPIYSKKNGDIKYVWEKSRFSYLSLYMREDLNKDSDHSQIVFGEIISWIDQNPINLGPNYVCSQEIAIRVMNWTLALYFYSNSKHLTQDTLDKIFSSIIYQVKHVKDNINFSRIAVKNNHSISETLILYLYGLFFPFLPNANLFYHFGKKYFLQEVEDQIFQDGSDSQYSFNYLRVKLQLFTWAIYSANINNDILPNYFHLKIQNLLKHLSVIMLSNGNVPQYGANDGSLYFKLNACPYDDFRPQLLPLLYYYNLPINYNLNDIIAEDLFWFNGQKINLNVKTQAAYPILINYPDSGYYGIRVSEQTLLFVRFGNHKYRPSHSDNGHIDLWFNGINILRDSGTFNYMADDEYINFFTGVKGHNTFSIDGFDHMLRGPNFIWYNWTSASNIIQELDGNLYKISAIINFKVRNKWVQVKRSILYDIDKKLIQVNDLCLNYSPNKIYNYWHFDPLYNEKLYIKLVRDENIVSSEDLEDGYFSDRYGEMTECKYLVFSVTNSKSITTQILF